MIGLRGPDCNPFAQVLPTAVGNGIEVVEGVCKFFWSMTRTTRRRQARQVCWISLAGRVPMTLPSIRSPVIGSRSAITRMRLVPLAWLSRRQPRVG